MDVEVWMMRLDRAAARAARDALLAERPGSAASFSDSDGVAVLAIAPQGTVGIDVERVRERARTDAVARRVLGETEARALEATRGKARLERFYRAWTAAEASAKARGLGLPAMLGGRVAAGPRVTWFEPAPGFIGAVAGSEVPRLRLRELS
jgi:4'-phosphopantetheinyl transferase